MNSQLRISDDRLCYTARGPAPTTRQPVGGGARESRGTTLDPDQLPVANLLHLQRRSVPIFAAKGRFPLAPMVRHAANLTQQDLADFLGVSQVAIQKTEQRSDMLRSTLRRYLLTAGADMQITVRWPDGRHAELTLDDQIGKPTKPSNG